MAKIKYLMARILKMNYIQLLKTINKVHEKANISRTKIFFDMIDCGMKYQAGYMDYDLFNMYELNDEERKTILTRGKNNEFITAFNNTKYFHIFDNKDEFNERFKNYLNRDYFIVSNDNYEEFLKFLDDKKEIVVKPLNLSCGKGIEKLKVTKTNKKELFDKILKNETFLVEEVAIQNKIINKLHPESVNTIRIVTLRNKYNVTSVVASFIRIGTGKNVVDNFNHGGICAPVSLDDGVITHPAVDKNGNTYKIHPDTKINLVGYALPLWNDVLELVKEASKEVPEIGLVGWDVCIGNDKPCLIEANQFPGHDIYQLPAHRDGNIGVLPIFEEAISRKH